MHLHIYVLWVIIIITYSYILFRLTYVETHYVLQDNSSILAIFHFLNRQPDWHFFLQWQKRRTDF